MQAHFQGVGKASDTVRPLLGIRSRDLFYKSSSQLEGRTQVHLDFAQSVPSAFLSHLCLKIQGRTLVRQRSHTLCRLLNTRPERARLPFMNAGEHLSCNMQDVEVHS